MAGLGEEVVLFRYEFLSIFLREKTADKSLSVNISNLMSIISNMPLKTERE